MQTSTSNINEVQQSNGQAKNARQDKRMRKKELIVNVDVDSKNEVAKPGKRMTKKQLMTELERLRADSKVNVDSKDGVAKPSKAMTKKQLITELERLRAGLDINVSIDSNNEVGETKNVRPAKAMTKKQLIAELERLHAGSDINVSIDSTQQSKNVKPAKAMTKKQLITELERLRATTDLGEIQESENAEPAKAIKKEELITVRLNEEVSGDKSDQTKKCTLCEVELPLNAFNKLKTGSNGRHSHCKSCRKDQRGLDKHPRAADDTIVHCHRCDKDLFAKDFNKNCRMPNGLQKYCKACQRDFNRSPERYFDKLVSRITSRYPDSTLEREELISLYAEQSGLCAKTGIQISHFGKRLKKIYVQRIDDNLPYSRENVILICKLVKLLDDELTAQERKAVSRMLN